MSAHALTIDHSTFNYQQAGTPAHPDTDHYQFSFSICAASSRSMMKRSIVKPQRELPP